MNFPPSDSDFENLAIAALGKLSGKDIEVLVFADNPSLMMSVVYVPRGCLVRSFISEDRSVTVYVGKTD